MQKKKRALSRRAATVLDAIAKHGPLPNALDPQLVAVAGSGAALYETLLLLRGRFLIRWDPKGVNLRATGSGRQLIGSSYYRELLSNPSLGRPA